MIRSVLYIISFTSFFCTSLSAGSRMEPSSDTTFDVSGFYDSSHHWYDIEDDEKMITQLPGKPRYAESQYREIADNIILYQKKNGGWPKNYDMLAILTPEQRAIVGKSNNDENTTYDNGSTHSQIDYLARVYSLEHEQRWKNACLRGIDFILSSQYTNGGWPQFYPDTSGYRKYITFNDGAMVGIMKVLYGIVSHSPEYDFVDTVRRVKATLAFRNGIGCILNCQWRSEGKRLAWGQQHDNVTLQPREARNFEPASLAARESAEILIFLMSLDHPDKKIIDAVNDGISWLKQSEIHGIRVEEIRAPVANYKYSKNVNFDRIVVEDPQAPPIWARMYDLGTNVPVFCNRDKIKVYSLAEVDRERRTGYTWYTGFPAEALKAYTGWKLKWGISDTDRK